MLDPTCYATDLYVQTFDNVGYNPRKNGLLSTLLDANDCQCLFVSPNLRVERSVAQGLLGGLLLGLGGGYMVSYEMLVLFFVNRYNQFRDMLFCR